MAAQSEEGARAEQSPVLWRAGAARDGATDNEGLLAPVGGFPLDCWGVCKQGCERDCRICS